MSSPHLQMSAQSEPADLPQSSVYCGHVVHKRLRPKRHALRYSVFSMLIDLDKLPALESRLRLFSRNRWNVFSLHDKDHGPGDGTALGDIARACLEKAGMAVAGRRILLLCYPRLFGYVFNPLSVYFVYTSDGVLEALIYEVSNTFGERTSYVVPAGAKSCEGVYAHACDKTMYVSPFTSMSGAYGFRVTEPDGSLLVAVSLRDGAGPLLKTHFKGNAEPLDDRHLLSLLWRYPLLTMKVIVAIHYEAVKLWLKGVPLTVRYARSEYSISAPKLPQIAVSEKG